MTDLKVWKKLCTMEMSLFLTYALGDEAPYASHCIGVTRKVLIPVEKVYLELSQN
jgi:hypothetical protein